MTKMKPVYAMLVKTQLFQWRQLSLMAGLVLLAACDSSNDGSGMMPGDGTMSGGESSADIMSIVSRAADSEPFKLETEAIDAQLVQLFGDRNTAEPVLFEAGDTAETVVGKRHSQ